FHTMTESSSLAEAMCRPSGEYATDCTVLLCSLRLATSSCSFASHTRMEPSPCVDTSRRLSGENVRLQTLEEYSSGVIFVCRIASQSRILSDPVATRRPSGE